MKLQLLDRLNGEQAGREEFKHRNFMNNMNVNCGHAPKNYTKDIIPAGKDKLSIPIAEDATAEHYRQTNRI